MSAYCTKHSLLDVEMGITIMDIIHIIIDIRPVMTRSSQIFRENSIVGEMKDANVPGTAIAIINKNQIAYENPPKRA